MKKWVRDKVKDLGERAAGQWVIKAEALLAAGKVTTERAMSMTDVGTVLTWRMQ